MKLRITKWILLLLAAVVSLADPVVVAAQESSGESCLPTSRPQDQIWLVSSRQLDCVDCPLTSAPRVSVWKYDRGQNAWQSSSVEAFLTTDDPQVPTNIFVHGNWITLAESVQAGFTYYRHQAQYAPEERPLRLVLWSWPSDKTDRPLRDVRAKYVRTDSEAHYLAWFLGRIEPRVKVSLVGYSYGATIVAGSLHGLAVQSGAADAEPAAAQTKREPCRAVLFAAAAEEHILATGEEYGLALTQVERMLVIFNGCDFLLKRFRLVDRCARPEALGYWGVAGPLGEHASKVRQLDAAPHIGKDHHWRPYVTTPSLITAARPYVWFDDAFSAAPPADSPPMAKLR